jgi:hypothetical protein
MEEKTTYRKKEKEGVIIDRSGFKQQAKAKLNEAKHPAKLQAQIPPNQTPPKHQAKLDKATHQAKLQAKKPAKLQEQTPPKDRPPTDFSYFEGESDMDSEEEYVNDYFADD